ncbi:ABC transporter substrate-binding protein [Ruania halotolerans]|uniref:ABC transporter substrate-binding protein n=1 Tax=Ruania halotolerans TaxID=2897773 RepID=UPI001E5EF287|nr:ABC transporter substrate-binding protein [Ruania halotolerans]UFU08286.1 ABC transporter substrate-binding protein [Ruania halotolerans]
MVTSPHHPRRRTLLAAACVTFATALAGCTAPATEEPETSDGGASAGQAPSLTIGLTYVPNVQFAPFYRAEQEGYFDEAGVDVTLRHHGESEDLFGALTDGTEQVVVAGGDEMMQARDQGVPVVSIATLYTSYPVALIVPTDSEIESPADLAGRTVGVPGPFGETYFGLLAMLAQADLTEADVTIEHIGFTQQSALSEGHVDAVMGYQNNDIPQFAATGLDVRAVPIGDVPLVGIGLGTTEDLTTTETEALRGVVSAVERAVADIVADPSLGVHAAIEEIPGTVDAEQEAIMRATMEATVPLYGEPGPGWGSHTGPWREMSAFLAEAGLTETTVPADEAYNDAFTDDE